MTRVLRCALVLLLLIAGGVAGTASPSWARCYSSTCTGQDPVLQGCGADARTIDTIWVGYLTAGQCSGLQAGGEGPRWEGR
ncbi:hypothetical protein ABGB16_31675 [Micromonospora sp. B11E3]|uniref:hypothetical protein n=1 Tax=Micromonospora sp. B11E3 TaxID=3153562 RepID=UPI00325C86CC